MKTTTTKNKKRTRNSSPCSSPLLRFHLSLKLRFLLLCILGWIVPSTAQQIIIGDDNNYAYTHPFFNVLRYNWNESIYPANAFPSACTINSLSFDNAFPNRPLNFVSLKIYMGETARSYIESGSDWTPEDDLTLVYSGNNISLGIVSGWNEIVLDTPFVYEKEGNLVVVVSVNLANIFPWSWWGVSETTPNNTSIQLGNNLDISYSEYPTDFSGNIGQRRANIKLSVVPISISCHRPISIDITTITSNSIVLSWTPYAGTASWDVYIGDTPTASTTPTASGLTSPNYTFTGLNSATAYKCYVRTNCGEGEVSSWKRISVMTEPDFIGEGTESSPYLLYSKRDLDFLNVLINSGWSTKNKYFKVMQDIATLSEPIGLSGYRFFGHFDGNGHSITLDIEGTDNLALFSRIGPDAHIHNITVDGSIIGNSCLGGIVGRFETESLSGTEDAFISNCVNKAIISGSGDCVGGIIGYYCGVSNGNGSLLYITECKNKGSIVIQGRDGGGIAGKIDKFGTINGCENWANIVGTRIEYGGIVGVNGDNCLISNCINRAEIDGGSSVGGIVGRNNSDVFNCYNLGGIIGNNSCGGIIGYNRNGQVKNNYNAGLIECTSSSCNSIIGSFSYGTIDGAYYLNGTCEMGIGGVDSLATNCSSFTQDTVDPTVCTLDTMCYNSTDLRTALNNWRDGNTDYNEWLTDIYGNNNHFPTFAVGSPPGLEITPNPLSMGPRPIGANMHGEHFTLTNTGTVGIDISTLDIAGSPFFVLDSQADHPETPFLLDGEESVSISVATRPDATVVPGETTGSLVALWNGRNVSLAEMTATAYLPEIPDLVETPLSVDSFPFTTTQNTALIYDNYLLPGSHADGPDGVYKLTFTEDVLLNANVREGEDPKIALYAEDFEGKPYPHNNNCFIGPTIGAGGNTGTISEWIYYDDGVFLNSIGGGGALYWGIKFETEDLCNYADFNVTKIAVYDFEAGNYILKIYQGGENAPENLIYTKNMVLNGIGSMHEESLNSTVVLDIDQPLWIVIYSNDTDYPASASANTGNPNGRWISLDGTNWEDIASVGFNYTWMIRAYVSNGPCSKEKTIIEDILGEKGIAFESCLETREFYPFNFGGDSAITNLTVPIGTYYLVASSTRSQYTLDINTEALPLPLHPTILSPLNGESNVLSPVTLQWILGRFTTEYQLVMGTIYPPSEIVQNWTRELANSFVLHGLSNNTTYFWQVNERNSTGTTYGPVWGFTSALNIPQNLTAFNDKLFEGDTLALSWTPVNDRSHHGYNLYRDGVKINENPITGTSYSVEGLSYNMGGYRFNVTALYDEGESRYSNAVLIRVSGSGSVSGFVFEQDSVTGIAEATVTFTGIDEYDIGRSFSFTSNQDGSYSGNIYAGVYYACATAPGYRNSRYSELVEIEFDSIMSGINIIMHEILHPVGAVYAEETDSAVVKVYWSWTAPVNPVSGWLYYDDGIYSGSIGADGAFYWGVSFPDLSDYAGTSLTKIAYYDAAWPGTITLNVYLGGMATPQTLAASQVFNVAGSNSMVEIELDTPVDLDGSLPL